MALINVKQTVTNFSIEFGFPFDNYAHKIRFGLVKLLVSLILLIDVRDDVWQCSTKISFNYIRYYIGQICIRVSPNCKHSCNLL